MKVFPTRRELADRIYNLLEPFTRDIFILSCTPLDKMRREDLLNLDFILHMPYLRNGGHRPEPPQRNNSPSYDYKVQIADYIGLLECSVTSIPPSIFEAAANYLEQKEQ
tara:strand:- start:347 stop:673 length:327 start_codon:yes stop_codon:yes gene_type:complete